MWQRIRLSLRKISTIEYNPRYSRLAGDMECFGCQLRKRIIDTGSEQKQWAIKSLELIEQAEKFLKEFKIDEGWKSLHAAKRMEIYGMDQPERLALAKSLVKEADKLNGWRRDAIKNMLADSNNLVTNTPEPAVLIQAAELKDEDYNNMYYMNRLTRNIFWLLSFLLFLVLFGIVIYFLVCNNLYGTTFEKQLSITGYIIGVLLFGFLGAITSAILFTRGISQSSRIKEIATSEVMVMSKLFIGAGFSVFIFLLLKSSVADGISLFSFPISQPIDYFAIAFASGFTEQLATKSMNLLIGKEKKDKPTTTGQDSNG